MTAVLLFAKAPRPGYVKTRLAAEIGDGAAVAAYRKMGARVVAQVSARYPITVWYDPPDALAEMRVWLGERSYRPQEGRDLGERLTHAFAEHFGRGDGPVLAIGADAPDVDADTIAAAERALRSADVVLGPALDGGYYLVGLARERPEVFAAVPWGGADVMRITLERCRRLGMRAGRLPVLRDLDTAADLRALGDIPP